MFIKFQEVYLNGDSSYKEIKYPVYISIDKIVSIVPLEIKGFNIKCYGLKLVDGTSYRGHSRDVTELLLRN